jgi:serine/threonine-protein kinase
MGEVYLAKDTLLQRKVVLKFPLPNPNAEEDTLKPLFREASATAALDHPYICKVYDTGKLGDRRFSLRARSKRTCIS